jgi:hypothetical protein
MIGTCMRWISCLLRERNRVLGLAALVVFGAGIQGHRFNHRDSRWDLVKFRITVEAAGKIPPESRLLVDVGPGEPTEGDSRLSDDGWDAQVRHLLDKWTPASVLILVSDSSAPELGIRMRSRLVRELQIPNVYVLDGGWEAWNAIYTRH